VLILRSARHIASMAEPTNTPMPSGTPVSGLTPRSGSPVLSTHTPISHHFASLSVSQTSPTSQPRHTGRPVVLHIGDPIKYHPDIYTTFSRKFEVIRPSREERERPAFIAALKSGKWGSFSAIFRPFWGSGGEMGRWDPELISLLPSSVRVFAAAGAGFDWADTQMLGEHGIIYCNSGLAAAEAVADFAVAMVVSTFRHLPWCMGAATLPCGTESAGATEAGHGAGDKAKDGKDTREAMFQACHTHATAQSRTLRDHTLGLIGLGNIGQHIAAKLGNSAFGMKIRYHDVERKGIEAESRLGAIFDEDLNTMLQASDCVIVCTPALPHGKALITASTLAQLKHGARFINVARGSLVDEEALADALDSGAISSAALDVHAHEPRPNPRLLALALPAPDGSSGGRVMMTCHNAGGTLDTHAGFEELSMRNIMAVLDGKAAITPVNMAYLKRSE
jgi:lactate dehydrogenase-like 2-hydroxyacid dehydrogenase